MASLFVASGIGAAVPLGPVASVAPVSIHSRTSERCPSLSQGDRTVCSTSRTRSPLGTTVSDLHLNASSANVVLGQNISFSAVAPSGVTIPSYNWSFGDGTSLAGAIGPVIHQYTTPGVYLVEADGVDTSGTAHNNLDALLEVRVFDSYASSFDGTRPLLDGAVWQNDTVQGVATAITTIPGSLSVYTWVLTPPTSGDAWTGLPTYALVGSSAGVSLSQTDDANGSAWATVVASSSAAPGFVELAYTIPEWNGSAEVSFNYQYTIALGAGLGAGPLNSYAAPASGLEVYEYAPGGGYSLDPAIVYDTVDYEVMDNVYQTLIAFNGSSTGEVPQDFIPELATCVPGSIECSDLYGAPLLSGTNYTFVISPDAQFYDPSTGAHWGVYPTDVLFSFVRTLAFSTLPCWECNNGWILAQSMLSAGNATWDGGIHSPANNTPSEVLGSMTINGTDCPASAYTTAHGCITIDADAGGHSWPFFLQTVAESWGASIVPCGWFSAPQQGAGIPYWTAGNVTGAGDHPCAAPGSSGYGVSPASMPATGWDSWEEAGSGLFGTYLGNVQWNMVGSGPYYLQNVLVGESYTLAASPAYVPSPTCQSSVSCQPPAGSYRTPVNVIWEANYSAGQAALASGTAASATFDPANYSRLVGLIDGGRALAQEVPSFTNDFLPFNLAYNVTMADNATGLSFTAPSELLSDVDLRQFLVHAMPYSAVQQSVNTIDGIADLAPAGPPIPAGVADYNTSNVSWPAGNPDSDAADSGGAAWWWAQAQSEGGPASLCSAVAPCTFPVASDSDAPNDYDSLSGWASTVVNLSSGAIVPVLVNVSFETIVVSALFDGPYGSPFAAYTLGWSPDFPDVWDYVVPALLPNAEFTFSDTVSEVLGSLNLTGCSQSALFWASNPIGYSCQGAAYGALVNTAQSAAFLAGAGRPLAFNTVAQIANRLALYQSLGMSFTVNAWAAWVNPLSIESSPLIQGSFSTTSFYALRALSLTTISGPGPLSASGGATPSTSDVGVPIAFYGSASGGTPPYTYSWSFGDGSLAVTTVDASHAYSANGNYEANLTVTDSLGVSATSTVPITVDSDPQVSLILAAGHAAIDLGQSFSIAVTSYGGSPPFVWNSVSNVPPGCSFAPPIPAPARCTPSSAGSYALNFSGTDAAGLSAWATLTVTVQPAPTILAFRAAPSSFTTNNSTSLTVTISGGTAPFSFVYSGLPSGCSTANRSTLTCFVADAGHYTVEVNATDAVGEVAHQSLLLAVAWAPISSPPGQSTQPTPTSNGTPTEIFGLSETEFWILVGVLVAAIVGAVVAVLIRRRQPPREMQEQPTPVDDGAAVDDIAPATPEPPPGEDA